MKWFWSPIEQKKLKKDSENKRLLVSLDRLSGLVCGWFVGTHRLCVSVVVVGRRSAPADVYCQSTASGGSLSAHRLTGDVAVFSLVCRQTDVSKLQTVVIETCAGTFLHLSTLHTCLQEPRNLETFYSDFNCDFNCLNYCDFNCALRQLL